ncbi:sensor histidine kinase [Catellatospora coxensis]|uniref:histidine kinase n=1 Tax=Catellatospora coxensis TaxID=310354 RepID=A0A8J3L4N4_9ACTN|nr:sensor histidine kinase [Catellatospora coxensis]GIG06450.1 histidine kinase [Catellatospora coxensis]
MSLFWRIFLLNAAVLVAATMVLLLGPVTVSTPVVLTEALVLAVGLALMLVANAALLRVGLAPLHRLGRAMATLDLLQPAPRPIATGHAGIADLIRAFNNMIDRLEAERATSTARALSAQEDERRRVARELHDEVGQSLTAVLLQLEQVARHAPAPLNAELRQVQETTRAGLDEIRRIARRLRPGVLEELGLASALKALITEVTGHTDLAVTHRLGNDLPAMDDETELVIYRVAQEGLTNAVRHARATRVELSLQRRPGEVLLRVADDGRGAADAPEGAGIRGMRERALLIGASLEVTRSPAGGTEVRLRVPAGEASAA